MIKMYALLPKRPDISDEAFHEHWRTIHAEHALRITRLRRYVQAHRIPSTADGLAVAPYDGIPEVWYDDLDSALGQNSDPDYTEHAQKDEPNFVDMERIAFVPTADFDVLAGPALTREAPGVKLILLLRRPPDATGPEFAQAWRGVATHALASFGGARRTAAAVALPETYADGEPEYDGFAELFWSDLPALEADWKADGPQLLSAVGEVADLDRSHLYVADENRVIWP